MIDEGLPIVTIVDTKENTFKQELFSCPELAKTTPHPGVAVGASFPPTASELYLTTGPGRSVLIVDPAKKAAVATIDGVGAFPRGIAISADGKKLYTANGASNDVAIIDIASKKVEAARRRAGRAVGRRCCCRKAPRRHFRAGILRAAHVGHRHRGRRAPRMWSRRSARAWRAGRSSRARSTAVGRAQASRTTCCSRPIRRSAVRGGRAARRRAEGEPGVPGGGVAGSDVAADVLPLRRRHEVRRPRRRRDHGRPGEQVRCDVAMTVCLSDAAEYEGGELVIDAAGVPTRWRGKAGDADRLPRRHAPPGHRGHERHARRRDLLDPEHGARRRPPAHPVRSQDPRSTPSTPCPRRPPRPRRSAAATSI